MFLGKDGQKKNHAVKQELKCIKDVEKNETE